MASVNRSEDVII